MYQGILYTKKIKTNENKTFDQWLFKLNNEVTFQAQLSNDCKKQLLKEQCEAPYNIVLGDEDYFMKKERYENKKGEQRVKDIIVILNYHSVTQAVFEKRTLDMVMQERTNAVPKVDTDIEQDLPF